MSRNNSRAQRTVRIGMPQMANGCLSENWLFKELGSFHWDRLCDALRRKSHELADSEGRRLYATFVRVRLDLNGTLADFHEGDELRLNIQMARYGRSSLLSTINIEGNASSGVANLMSTFSCRIHEDNTLLARSEPAGEYDSSVTHLAEAPRFFTEYSEMRKRFGKQNGNEVAKVYQINPYIDINGANLLYFASYQSIHDFLSFIDTPDFHTTSRDICYFRNCKFNDRIGLTLASDITRSNRRIQRGDILFRYSDCENIAYISTVKEC